MKSKLTTYRRKAYARYRKRAFYKAVSSFHATKLSFSCMIDYYGSNLFFDFNNGKNFELSDGLARCTDFKNFRNIFLLMKVKGLAISVMPHPPVKDFNGQTVMMGVMTDTDGLTPGDIIESNNGFPLPFTNIMSKYISFKGASTGWISSTNNNVVPGVCAIAAPGAATQGAMRWTVKFTYYVIYKVEC